MLPKIFQKIFNLFVIIKIMQYLAAKASLKWLLGLVKRYITVTRSAQSEWAHNVWNYLRVQAHVCENSQQLQPGRVIVFANHRCQGDFFLHNVIMNYQTNFLSRLAVLIAAPVFIVAYRDVWFFHRNHKTDPEKYPSLHYTQVQPMARQEMECQSQTSILGLRIRPPYA
jgi:hypothetical protein